MRRLRFFQGWFVVVVTLTFFPVRSVRADDTLRNVPAPESADQLPNSFDQQLEGEEEKEIPIDEFLQSSQLTLHFRNYYLNRARPENTDPRAWTQGNSIEYKVGRVGGIFGLAVEYFGSFPLYSPEDHDGTLLLEPGQSEIDVLGVLNPRVNLFGQVLTLYRQKFDLPFLNQQDNRMIPNTFEGYAIGMPKSENEQFQYIVGYVDSMKKRESDSFISMSDAAGIGSKENGLTFAGLRYFVIPELSVGAINLFIPDIFNTAYVELVHKKKFDEDMANSFSFQYGDQRSTGEDLLRGDEFSSGFWGFLNSFSYKHAIFKAAFNMTDSAALVRSPYGSYAGYTSSIVEDFNRAGEKSWLLGGTYEFGRFGMKGLSFNAAYIHGFGAIDEITKESLADKAETDLTLDYRFQEGAVSGLWIRLRAAFIEEDEVGTTEDYRIIVNYDIPLYKPEAPAA